MAKIVLVTGANTGLGFETIKALCASSVPYEILLGGRSLAKANAAVNEAKTQSPAVKGRISAIQIDLDDDESINNAFEIVKEKYGRLDILINNAGAQLDPQLTAGKLTMREMWTASWTTNTVGTQIVTNTFVPLLLASSEPRLLFITSGTSSLAGSENAQLPFNLAPGRGWPKTSPPLANIPAYRSSKAGMNMLMREWHRALQNDGVKVWCVSPGYLATGLGNGQETNKAQGAIDPAIGGEFVKDVVEGKRDDDVGKVIVRNGVQPW